MGRVAYVDESYVAATSHYLLAAVIVDTEHGDGLRASTRAVPRRARTQFHWHDEHPDDRAAMVEHLATRTDVQVVVVSQPVAEARSERARGKCLGSLLGLLTTLHPIVEDVVLERRTTVQDKRDIARVGGMQTAGRLPRSIRLRFEAKSEALLWLPDALAGAVNAELAGDPSYTAAFGHGLIRVHIGGAL